MTTIADPHAAAKRAAGEAAAREVQAGMLVGLGTGSTARFAIEAIGRRVQGGLCITAVATSVQTEALARACGIRVIDFAGVSAIDLAIDGVDEIDPSFRAIKGAGGAMLREKIVAASAARMIAVADPTKQVDRLGGAPVPIEVLPFAQAFVQAQVAALGAMPVPRRAGDLPYRSDSGNPVIDCRFAAIPDPAALAATLSAIPGLLGHGLFLDEIDAVCIGGDWLGERVAPR